MSEGLKFTLQIFGFLVGFLAICAGLFLYEDETGNIQNRLEDLWIKIHDQSKAKLTRHKRFIREVALLTNRMIDNLFSEKQEASTPHSQKRKARGAHRKVNSTPGALPFKPISPLKVNNVVTTLWVISVAAILFIARDSTFLRFQYYTSPACRLLFYTYLFFAGAIASRGTFRIILFIIIKTDRIRRIVWYFVVGLVGLLVVVGPYLIEKHLMGDTAFGFALQLKTLGIIYFGGLLSILAYQLFIFSMRLMLVTDFESEESFSPIGVLGESLLLMVMWVPLPLGTLVILFLASPGDTGFLDGSLIGSVTFIVAASNLYLAFLSVGFFFLSFTMLAHRLFWPMLARPVYALQKLGIAKRQKVITLLGIGLCVTSVGLDSTWLKKLLVDLATSIF